MIERKSYLEKLIALKDKQLIKVVTGIRRCGKSTLFKLYQDYLLSNGVDKVQIININFEDADFEDLQDYKKLYEYLKSKLLPQKMTYIFLDEIQNVKNFQKVVDSLYIKDNVDIYITGSNAYLLSGELATLLSGRYIQIKMLPLSFQEYYSAAINSAISVEKVFSNYINDGGFPYLLNLPNDSIKKDYLEGIYNTIVVKDVMTRNKISESSILQSLIKFIFDNIGNTVSSKKISDTLTSYGRKVSSPTIESYLQALEDSYIVNRVNRYEVSGKQILKTQCKYFVTDLGLQKVLLSNSKANYGHKIENIVYLELLRRNYKVFVGKVNNLEVDFVAEKDGLTEYYQVSQTVLDESVLERELKPLKGIKDHNLKFLLTMDIVPKTNYNGIRQLNIIDWLLEH